LGAAFALLSKIAKRGNASFLAVLKKLGPSSRGIMSFPFPGFTLALDLALDKGVFAFLDEIDTLVAASGGRIYLAKDARNRERPSRRVISIFSAFAKSGGGSARKVASLRDCPIASGFDWILAYGNYQIAPCSWRLLGHWPRERAAFRQGGMADFPCGP
jgi:hypothetical protein